MLEFNEIQTYWDEYASAIQANGAEWGSREFFRQVKEDHDKAYAYSNQILNIPAYRGKRILEICCGIGIDALELAKHGANVTFISPSPKCIELTKTYFSYYGLNATLEVANAENLPFQANTFDIVIARGILMFTPHPDRVMDEIYRVLKPEGEVFAHLHNKHSWYIFLAKLSRTNLVYEAKDPPIYHQNSIQEAKKMFARFSSLSLFLDRFPLPTTKRSGVLAILYNSIFIPLTKTIPREFMKSLGYYIIIKARKTDNVLSLH